MKDNLLQNRINEVDSAIINFVENKVHITGFYNADRLTSHLELGKDNWRSKGIYDENDVTFSNIKNDALFLVLSDGKTIDKYQFIVIFRETLQRFKPAGSIIVTVRKNNFADQWQVLSEKNSFEFTTKAEAETHLRDNYKGEFNI